MLYTKADLTKEYRTVLNQEPDFKMLCEQLDRALEVSDLALSPSFFDRPKDLPVIEAIKVPYQRWLQSYGFSAAEADAVADRLPRYFVFALNEQWRSHPQDYASLKEQLDTLFTKASEREIAWFRYLAWLQRRIDEPMFAEAFSLRQIYIPLRAYYEQKVKKEKVEELDKPSLDEEFERVVVKLEEQVTAWLNKADKEDAIRVICGGPGCGKSSFAKMLAAKVAELGIISVLFIPLHQFNPLGDLVDAMGDFIRLDLEGIFPPNPLERDDAEKLLLLIFDGLDELAMQGKVAAQVAREFVQEVQKKLLGFNHKEARVLVLMSGVELLKP